jgi:uncharacterized protein
MHFEGEFSVPGKPQEIMRRFADVPRMASCMPGAALEPQADDGSWPGAMVVTFGPKKINFKGRVTTHFDFDALTGSLYGRGTADMRAARIGVKVIFTLRSGPAATSPRTVVNIVSDAELGGVLADFARTGGTAVAHAIMDDFAKRLAAEFGEEETSVAGPVSAEGSPSRLDGPSASAPQQLASSPGALRSAPLAAQRMLWLVLKAYLAQLGRWLGLVR